MNGLLNLSKHEVQESSNMILSFIDNCMIPQEALKTSGFAHGLQHFPQNLGNVIEWNIIFDPSIYTPGIFIPPTFMLTGI